MSQAPLLKEVPAVSIATDAITQAEQAAEKARQQAREKIEKRLAELAEVQNEVRELQDALRQLDRGTRGTSNAAPRRRSSGQRLSNDERKNQVLEIVRSSPGIKQGQIAEQISVSGNRVATLIAELREEGRLSKKGEPLKAA